VDSYLEDQDIPVKPFSKEWKNKLFWGGNKEVIFYLLNDFAEKIRSKREKLGLKQSEFAKKISEKESIIHKLETGEFKPSLELASKLEKVLNIKLIEEYEEEHLSHTKTDSTIATIGDLVKIKRRNK